MSGHALRLDERSLRFLIIGAGLCWSIAFVVIALFYELELYGAGAMFSYAVAVRDVWAFHWHNISGRTSVFLLSLLPAEALVGISGNPWVGIITYGLLFYISPFVGLILTYVADRSPGNTIFVYACTSTAMLCPLIFGFPTVARPRDILARAGTQSLREANRRRFHVGICRTVTAGLYA